MKLENFTIKYLFIMILLLSAKTVLAADNAAVYLILNDIPPLLSLDNDKRHYHG